MQALDTRRNLLQRKKRRLENSNVRQLTAKVCPKYSLNERLVSFGKTYL